MRATFLATALVALVSAGSAVADTEFYLGSSWVTGNELKERCGSASHVKRAFCMGFAAAVAGIVGDDEYQGFRACFPDGITARQLSDVVTKFLDENPEQLHYSAESLAAWAFEEAFPCPQ